MLGAFAFPPFPKLRQWLSSSSYELLLLLLQVLGGVTWFFLTNVFNGSEYFSAVLETVVLGVPYRNLGTLACLMSTLNVIAVPLDALSRQMPSTVIPAC